MSARTFCISNARSIRDLVAIYPDREALDVYTVHPEHQEVAALGKQIAEKVVSVDFID